MGDRTSVTLQLLGSISAAQLAALAEIIEENEGGDEWGDPASGVWGWSDRYAELGTETRGALAEAGVTYALWWGECCGAYSAGVEIHQPEGVTQWGADDNAECLLMDVRQATDPEKLARAIAHQALVSARLTLLP